jgi:hypothetical protein
MLGGWLGRMRADARNVAGVILSIAQNARVMAVTSAADPVKLSALRANARSLTAITFMNGSGIGRSTMRDDDDDGDSMGALVSLLVIAGFVAMAMIVGVLWVLL